MPPTPILTQTAILSYLKQLKKTLGPARVYTPVKYFTGLTTKKQVKDRFVEICKGRTTATNDPKAYKPSNFRADKNVMGKTKTSSYTILFRSRWGEHLKSLEQKAEATGVPLDILKKVYNKGCAAWRTGHRVGANQQQWGYARVHSFLVLGCTAFGSDFTLLKEAYDRMTPKARKIFFLQRGNPISCPVSKLHTPYFSKLGSLEVVNSWRKQLPSSPII